MCQTLCWVLDDFSLLWHINCLWRGTATPSDRWRTVSAADGFSWPPPCSLVRPILQRHQERQKELRCVNQGHRAWWSPGRVRISLDASYMDRGLLWNVETGCQGFLCPLVKARWKNYTLCDATFDEVAWSSINMLASPGYLKWISEHWVPYRCSFLSVSLVYN